MLLLVLLVLLLSLSLSPKGDPLTRRSSTHFPPLFYRPLSSCPLLTSPLDFRHDILGDPGSIVEVIDIIHSVARAPSTLHQRSSLSIPAAAAAAAAAEEPFLSPSDHFHSALRFLSPLPPPPRPIHRSPSSLPPPRPRVCNLLLDSPFHPTRLSSLLRVPNPSSQPSLPSSSPGLRAMAGTSPTRRSSRARTTQSQSHHSSATSSSSGRAERSTRAFTKTGSPQKSTGSGSLSSEPPDDSATATTNNDDNNTILRRRSTRGKEDDRDKQPKIELLDMAPASDEVQEDDEAVRCICGHDEYPGPPPFDEDSKHGIKDAIDHERIFAIEITDEMAGFFVQCEICNTWQHGACVGFTTEESNPDDLEYFCEQCRKDLHKIYTASNGQKYSIFLPIHRPSRAASRATSAAKDGARSPKSNGGRNSRSSAAAHTSKRRSTMNSRDAAYYEEEQIRRAIEASKEDAIPEEQEPTRRTKRGRDDSEEKPESIKRQRTNSKSPSPVVEKPQSINQDESEDESALRNGSSKKSRNAARNQREKAERDERREEQERKRAEAASKRKGRAERRRADDSDPSEEMPLAARATAHRTTTESVQPPEPPQPSSQPPPDTPPAPPAPTTSHKKKSTTHTKKKGRNQYTKDRDNHDHDDSPARSVSRDVGRNADENGASHTKASGHEGTTTTKHTKSKGGMNSRITMSDMKRRANGILEYISRTQVELASEPFSQSKSKNNQSNGAEIALPQIRLNGNNNNNSNTTIRAHDAITTANGAAATITADPTLLMKEFRDLSCVEMMDALTRDLVKWQQEFAP